MTETLAEPVVRVLDLTEELIGLIGRENRLLETRRPREAKALQGEKLRLTAEYRAAIERLRAEEMDLLGPRDSAVRRRLKAATERFRAELARHARLVIRLKTLTEGLVRAVSEEAMRQRGHVRRYGGDAAFAPSPGRPQALALDRSV